jgi:PAS domain S-box-containing protein
MPSAELPAHAPGWKPLLQASSQGRIVQWNDAATELFGWTSTEACQRWLHQLFRPSDATGFYTELQSRLDHASDSLESPCYGKDGRRGTHRFQVRWAEDGDHVDLAVWDEHASPLAAAPAAAPAMVSVSPQTGPWWPQADMDRERLMLTETHHRITNHLQLISSLLNLQSNAVEDESARQALRSSQNRVRAIAVLHQHLYSLAMGQAGSLQEFVSGLVEHLRQCFGVTEQQVKVNLDLQDARIRDEWVMPVALILNEAISNAFKHAFPAARSGLIEIQLTLGEQDGHLIVRDNGVGLPPGFDAAQSLGLGLKVIGVFAEQMRGRISLKNIEDIGLLFDLHFPIACVDN